MFNVSPVLSNCLPHGPRIETRIFCVPAHDDSVGVGPALAATPTCRPKGGICGQDCPSLLQIGAWPLLGHQLIHTPIDSNIVHGTALGNAMAPERHQLWQQPSLTSGWPLEVHMPPNPHHAFRNLQNMTQVHATLLSCVVQCCSLPGLLVEVLNGRPWGARNGRPSSPGFFFFICLRTLRTVAFFMMSYPVSKVNHFAFNPLALAALVNVLCGLQQISQTSSSSLLASDSALLCWEIANRRCGN